MCCLVVALPASWVILVGGSRSKCGFFTGQITISVPDPQKFERDWAPDDFVNPLSFREGFKSFQNKPVASIVPSFFVRCSKLEFMFEFWVEKKVLEFGKSVRG